MELNTEQYALIANCFPKHRKPAQISNLQALNACFYVLEHRCNWRDLPKEFGDWHTIYTRLARWAKNGVLQRVFLSLQEKGIMRIEIGIHPLHSACDRNELAGEKTLKSREADRFFGNSTAEAQKFMWAPHLGGNADE
ncbi:MAG: transposase [Clostridiales bacterium]|nr:transposase [Clostridiales bacterium]